MTSKGGHSKLSSTALRLAKKVWCGCCKKLLSNTSDSDNEIFLRNHVRQCKESPKKKLVPSVSVDQFLESFAMAYDENFNVFNDEETSEHLDYNEDFDDRQLELRGNLTAAECRLLDQDQAELIETEHELGSSIVYSPIHMLKYADKLRGFDINVLNLSDAVKELQEKLIKVLMMEDTADTKLMRFRSTSQKKVEWVDLIQLYDFGLSVGLSDASGNRLLSVINEILDRHASSILLRKSWRHIRMAIDKQKTRKCYDVVTLRMPLPEIPFGKNHYLTRRPLNQFIGTVEDIRGVVAELLLNIDPSKIVLEYEPTMDGDRVAPPDEQLLGEFISGQLFRQFSADAKKYGKDADGIPVVPLCFGVWADETTTSSSRNMSELPVYIALLNAVGDAYKMTFLAYAPYRLPHSEETLQKQLAEQGLEYKKWRSNVIRRTKMKILRDFLTHILKPLFSFGENCFQVQIGRDPSNVVNALFHVVQIGGDGKMLEELCGCFHSRHRFCRICLETRRSLFTFPARPAARRRDDEHESLTFQLSEADARVVNGYIKKATGEEPKAYSKTEWDRELNRRSQDLCIDAGDNSLYELFYYANCRKIGRGLHGSCWPDILHVVLKGIVEKNLSWSLAIIYGLHRVMGSEGDHYFDAMAILDSRIEIFPPVVNLPGIRWIRYRKGLSCLLKTETKSMSNSDNTTGLMSGGMESWKLIAALFQMMICIGSDGIILPNRTKVRTFRLATGFDDPCMQDVTDIVLSAAASCVEMYLAITSKVLRVGDIPTVQYLVDCAVFHHIRLSRFFKSLKFSTDAKKATSSSKTDLSLVPWEKAIGGNKCHLLRQHVVESKIMMGANPRQVDTELSEGFHKETVKKLFVRSSKRHNSRQAEMASMMSRERAVSNMLHTMNLQRVSGKRGRDHASTRGGVEAAGSLVLRGYHFSSETTQFAKFEKEGDRLLMSEEDRIRFFHPCISEEILNRDVSEFYKEHLLDLKKVEVFAIQTLTVQDSGSAEWKLLCKPAKVLSEECDSDDREQLFSGAFGDIDGEGQETFVRVLGIVLFMGKRLKANGRYKLERCYVAFVQPFEERLPADSVDTYLPFPVMYPHFTQIEDGRRGGRIKLKDAFTYYFLDIDALAGPAAIIRMPESIDGEILESRSMFESSRTVPPYLVIDTRRFVWPKDVAWNPSSYATDLVRHRNAVQRRIDLYPTASYLSNLQKELGLEDQGTLHGDIEDSLNCVDDEDDDYEDFRFLVSKDI